MTIVHRRAKAYEQQPVVERHVPNMIGWIRSILNGVRCGNFKIDVNQSIHWCGRHKHHPGIHTCKEEWE